MAEQTSTIISKVWGMCNPLRDDGVSYGDYLEQLFPIFWESGFIAVNDRYDSQEGGKQTAGLEVAFKNFYL